MARYGSPVPSSPGDNLKVALGFGAIGLIIFICLGTFNQGGSGGGGNQSSQPNTYQPRSSQSRTSRPRIGENAILSSDSGLRIPVGSTAKTLDRYLDLELADDDAGISAMRLAGMVRFLPSGTKCKVIKAGFLTYEVRLTEGDYNGQSCFVVAEFVKRK